MKKILAITLLFLCISNFRAYSQEIDNTKYNPDKPILIIPKNHDPDFAKKNKLPAKSFYESKSDWQHIIDSTWGQGDPLIRKLLIFNTYAQNIHDKFDGFISLQLNWDSLYNHYRNKIDTSTSKGDFSSIMSHFAYDLKDMHTMAFDTTVVMTPLNPGIPVFLLGNLIYITHFGAVTTILPDSTTLILRVLPDHPLNLEPGDIILGYEGVPWKNLVRELLDAGLPMIATTGGCKSADGYHNLIGAGLNWHLFDTIDILKYSTGDTLHLSVLPLLNLDIPWMVNNEQMPIQNISFPLLPPLLSDTVVTYGILENTNIGYIFLAIEDPTSTADQQFYVAINALKNTDALIIDIRFNLGGWAEFDKAFEVLFHEYHRTIEDAHRCNANTFELCPLNQWNFYKIDGMAPDYYDRPIAVLLGPSCVSMGDVTAQRLRYHPLVRFFGSSCNASLGDNLFMTNFPDWYFHYSIGDMFHLSEPGNYLNRKEFPVDSPVWFNKEDVAAGIDPVVENALGWINNLVYGHNLTTDKWWYSAGKDTVTINAIIENPNLHQVSAKIIFESLDGSVVDSITMAELKLTEGTQWQGKWITPGPVENTYWLSVKVIDDTDGTYFTSKHSSRITTVPLLIDSICCAVNSNTSFRIRPFLTNAGATQPITNITVRLTSSDTWVNSISPPHLHCETVSLLPGQTKGMTGYFYISYDSAAFPGYFNLTYSISSDGWPHWVNDTNYMIASFGINEGALPFAFHLNQNYPNPFYLSTSVSFSIPTRSFVSLKVFDLSGREVATIASEELSAGEYYREWNATNLPGGIYFYRLQSGEFTKTKKLVLLK